MVLEEPVQRPISFLDSLPEAWVTEHVIQLRNPTQVYSAVIATIPVNVVNNIPLGGRAAVKGKGDNTMYYVRAD
jgi:hypothetical protein